MKAIPKDRAELDSILVKLAKIEKIEGLSPSDVQIEVLKLISAIDRAIEAQLNEIFHHIDFQKIESAWRSLHFLITGFGKSRRLKFKVLNVTKDELLKDFEKSMEFDFSHLFDLLYKREYGSFGGEPYSLVVGDFYFTHRPRDMFLLESIGQVMSAIHGVFIDSADPLLFDMDDYQELGDIKNLPRIMDRKELVKWKSFRKKEIARYVCLTLPRVLLRDPHGPNSVQPNPKALNFTEQTHGADLNTYLWGNASFVIAQRICDAFKIYGWPVRFFGSDAGLVRALPRINYNMGDKQKIKTDVLITDATENELSEFGILPICYSNHHDSAVVLSTQSTHHPKAYKNKRGNENSRLSAMLPQVLTASRFAHYLNSILRHQIGKFTNRRELEKYLNNWLGQYVIADTSGDSDLRHILPLRASQVEIVESKRKPGKYFFIAYICPHYQLDGLEATVTMASEVPEGNLLE